jgi:hypothetical protein
MALDTALSATDPAFRYLEPRLTTALLRRLEDFPKFMKILTLPD